MNTFKMINKKNLLMHSLGLSIRTTKKGTINISVMIFRVFIPVMHHMGRFTRKHELARASGRGVKTRKAFGHFLFHSNIVIDLSNSEFTAIRLW